MSCFFLSIPAIIKVQYFCVNQNSICIISTMHFLEIAFVQEVSVCVCVHPRAINNHSHGMKVE